MSKVLVLKIDGRKFVTYSSSDSNKDNDFKTFIVNNISHQFNTNSVIKCDDCIIVDKENKIDYINADITVTKVVINRKQSFKKNRRKRYTRRVGYKERFGYCKVTNITVK